MKWAKSNDDRIIMEQIQGLCKILNVPNDIYSVILLEEKFKTMGIIFNVNLELGGMVLYLNVDIPNVDMYKLNRFLAVKYGDFYFRTNETAEAGDYDKPRFLLGILDNGMLDHLVNGGPISKLCQLRVAYIPKGIPTLKQLKAMINDITKIATYMGDCYREEYPNAVTRVHCDSPLDELRTIAIQTNRIEAFHDYTNDLKVAVNEYYSEEETNIKKLSVMPTASQVRS